MSDGTRPDPGARKPQLVGGPGPAKEGRKGEVRCRWVAGVRVCGGEGPRDAAKRGGGAAPGPPQQIGPTACLTQPRQWFHHLLPKYLITGDRKSPLENWDPPSPLLRAPVAPTPAASDTPLQPGLCTCLLPGAWEMLSQVGDAVGDRGAGSAHSGSWRPLPTLGDRVGSLCASHVTTPLWASVSSPRKWEVREPG